MDVNFKLGVDGSEELTTLKKIREGLAEVRGEQEATTKAIKERGEVSVAADKNIIAATAAANKTIEEQKRQIESLKAAIESMGKTGKSATEAYNTALKQSGDLLKNVSAAAGKGLLSPEETKKLTDALKNTKSDFQALGVIIDTVKKKLADLDPNSEEFKQLTAEIQTAEIILKAFGDQTDITTDKQASLKQELRAMTEELARMGAEGKKGTEEYEALKTKAGELFDTISDARDEIRQAGSDTQGFDKLIRVAQTVTGSFQIMQGAAALFGAENEDVQKALLKVNAAMSILNGLQAIQNELTKADSIYKNIAAGAQQFWNFTVNEGTVSLRVFKVALVATGIGAFIVLLGLAAESMGLFASETDDAAEKQGKLADEAERTKRILSDAADAALKQRDAGVDGLDILKRQLELAEKRGASEKEIAGLKTQIVNKEISDLNYLKGFYSDNADKLDEINKQLREKETERLGIKLELEKKTGDKIKELNKKNAEEDKKLAEDLTKFYQAAADDRVAAIADANERARTENINSFEKEVATVQDAYNKIIASQRLSAADRKELDEAFHKQLNDIAAKYAIKAVEIENKQQQDLLQVRRAISDAVIQINGTEKDQEIQAVKDKYDALRETLKKNGELFTSDEMDIAAKRKKEIQAINTKYDLDTLNKQETFAIANTEATTRNETFKQQKVLAIQLDFAKKKLALLEAAGGKENDVQVAQLRALITKLNGEIADSKKNVDANDWLSDAMGISKNDLATLENDVKNAIDNVISIMEQGLQRKIDLKQREIDSDNRMIDEANDALNREIELKKAGYASNIEAKQLEVTRLKTIRDNDETQQRAYVARMERLEKAKQAAAIATSVANMVNAASKIVESLTEEGGWVGAIIGIVEAAAIVAEFIALTNSIKASQKLEDGGLIGGKRHSQGGNKYISIDGNSMMEHEEGEFVVNRKSTNKYMPVIEAINKDELSSWTYGDLMKFIQPSDIRFDNAIPRNLVKMQKEVIHLELNRRDTDSDVYLREIAETNRAMFDMEKNKPEQYREGNDLVIRKGNHNRRIKDYYQ